MENNTENKPILGHSSSSAQGERLKQLVCSATASRIALPTSNAAFDDDPVLCEAGDGDHDASIPCLPIKFPIRKLERNLAIEDNRPGWNINEGGAVDRLEKSLATRRRRAA